jgi:ATP-dependent RNA helicase RhlE
MAMTFCDSEERMDFRNIERLTRQAIPVVEGHPYESSAAAPAPFNEREIHNVHRGPSMRPASSGRLQGGRGRSGGGGGSAQGGGGRDHGRRDRIGQPGQNETRPHGVASASSR